MSEYGIKIKNSGLFYMLDKHERIKKKYNWKYMCRISILRTTTPIFVSFNF